MPTRTRSLTVAAIIAIAFGLLTLVSGGRALFGGADMGAVVPFVLWFNFLAGFAYVAAGLGFWFRTDWATVLSMSSLSPMTYLLLALRRRVAWIETALEADLE